MASSPAGIIFVARAPGGRGVGKAGASSATLPSAPSQTVRACFASGVAGGDGKAAPPACSRIKKSNGKKEIKTGVARKEGEACSKRRKTCRAGGAEGRESAQKRTRQPAATRPEAPTEAVRRRRAAWRAEEEEAAGCRRGGRLQTLRAPRDCRWSGRGVPAVPDLGAISIHLDPSRSISGSLCPSGAISSNLGPALRQWRLHAPRSR